MNEQEIIEWHINQCHKSKAPAARIKDLTRRLGGFALCAALVDLYAEYTAKIDSNEVFNKKYYPEGL